MRTSDVQKLINTLQPSIESTFERTFGKCIENELDKAKGIASEYRSLLDQYRLRHDELLRKGSKAGLFYNFARFRGQLFDLLEKEVKLKEEPGLVKGLSSFFEQVVSIIETVPGIIVENQGSSRFQAISGDNMRTRWLKKIKNLFFSIQLFFVSLSARLGSGKSRSKSGFYWKHKIPLRNMIYFHLLAEGMESLEKPVDDLYLRLSGIYRSGFEWDNKLAAGITDAISSFEPDKKDDYKGALPQIPGPDLPEDFSGWYKTYIFSAFSSFLSDTAEKLADLTEKAGTLELPAFRYDEKRLGKRIRDLKSRYASRETGWNNTFFILSEDWKLDLEIFRCMHEILKEYHEFTGIVSNKLSEPLMEEIEKLEENILASKDRLPEDDATPTLQVLTDTLNAEKTEIKRQLYLHQTPRFRSLLENTDFPKYIDNAEQDIRKSIRQMSSKRYLIKDPGYDRKIHGSEMDSISPNSLVSFEMAPRFLSVFPELKSSMIRFLQEITSIIDEVPEVVDFSIESGISYAEEKGDPKEALKVVHEGYSRSLEAVNTFREKLISFISTESELFYGALDAFNRSITELTDNENAFQIKMRITKAKAIQKAKEIRKKAKARIRHMIPMILVYLRRSFRFLRESSAKLRQHFEADEVERFIATDTSDFLMETEKAISQLPFVYQRLFSIEPMQSFEFFIDRRELMVKLEKAFERWKEGKFAPVAVIGEKGSGKTSLIRHFVNKHSDTGSIDYLDFQALPQDPEQLFLEVNNKAGGFSEGTDDPFRQKKALVIDGLEKIFLSKVGGFELLRKVLHLISATNRRIFWIVACHSYSWKYLENSINISDYFGYHVKLSELKAGDIRKIIERRHSVSGFNLEFAAMPREKSIFGLTKAPQREDQEMLRKAYFEKLHNLAGANISIAMLLWLRSTVKVEGNTFVITSLDGFNYDFIRSISPDKLPVLRLLIIHNGLNINNLSKILRKPSENSMILLDQLADDGLLVRKDDQYRVNPLIYSPLIRHLFNLNLLH